MTVSRCRGCGADILEPILSLEEQPLANALTKEPAPAGEPRYPLELAICRACGLVQLTVSVPPEKMFSHYAYFSSYSPTLVASAAQLADRMVRERDLDAGHLVIEIGSNDGYLLQHYQARGTQVLGIDPAENVADAADERGVPTMCAFFGEDLGRRLAGSGRRAAVMHANNVLAHVPDVNGVLSGMSYVMADDGVGIVETPYVRDLIEKLEFDTIYHEHLYYYSVTALERLCRRNGLRLDRVEHIPVHGGSLRAFLVPDEGKPPPDDVSRWLEAEREAGVASPEYFRDFARHVHALRQELASLLSRLREEGAHVAGYGAAAKATVLLNAIGATRETLDFVADKSPHKQGLYVPGVGVPIVAPERLESDQPDYVLITAWTFAAEIMEEQAAYRRAGGRFIVPIPRPRVVEPDEDVVQPSSKSPAS